jgi:hypothetical protein
MDRDCQDKNKEESIRAFKLKFKISNLFAKPCFYPVHPVHPV